MYADWRNCQPLQAIAFCPQPQFNGLARFCIRHRPRKPQKVNPMPTVLTIGSLHYDIMIEATALPRRDETAVGSRWYPKFGGKGGNQAVAVAKAGGISRMAGAVGDDAFGTFLRDGLQQGRVDADHVATIPGIGSGMSVAILDSNGDYAATIVSGANLHIAPAALDFPGLWQDVAILVLQNEIPEGTNLAAATQARARAIPTLLNAAPYRPLTPELAALIDILVVNAVEAEMMGTAPVTDLSSAAEAAVTLAPRFATVIVTAGSAGLACMGQGGSFTVPAEAVKAVSSHGAGDAFIGTLAATLASGQPLQAACQAASQAAARHVAGL
jgi:ribokinase